MVFIIGDKQHKFEISDLPILIHGKEGSGASFFSIHLISQLFKAGNKILFFSVFPMAKDMFGGLLNKDELNNCEFVDQDSAIRGKQGIIVNSGEEGDFLMIGRKIFDLRERIIFLKNIDSCSGDILGLVPDDNKTIISGDVDRLKEIDDLKQIQFKNKIFFSESREFDADLNGIDRYKAVIVNNKNSRREIYLK